MLSVYFIIIYSNPHIKLKAGISFPSFSSSKMRWDTQTRILPLNFYSSVVSNSGRYKCLLKMPTCINVRTWYWIGKNVASCDTNFDYSMEKAVYRVSIVGGLILSFCWDREKRIPQMLFNHPKIKFNRFPMKIRRIRETHQQLMNARMKINSKNQVICKRELE